MENHNILYKKEHKLLQCTANFLAPQELQLQFLLSKLFCNWNSQS